MAQKPTVIIGEICGIPLALPPGEPNQIDSWGVDAYAARSGHKREDLLRWYEASFAWCSLDRKAVHWQPAAQKAPEAAIAALWRLKFSGVPWEAFCDLYEECEHRKVNPWCDHVTWKAEHDYRTGTPIYRLLMKLAGIRALARATGRYKGRRGPFWRGPGQKWISYWPHRQPPSAARVWVYIDGDERPTAGTAHWHAAAPIETVAGKQIITDPFWLKMPALMLAKVAEADALRAGIPELAGWYEPAEIRDVPPRPTPDRDREPGGDGQPFDENQPRTQTQFEQVLWRIGFRTEAARVNLIRVFGKMDDAGWRERNLPLFYKWVIKSLKDDPETYGALRESGTDARLAGENQDA